MPAMSRSPIFWQSCRNFHRWPMRCEIRDCNHVRLGYKPQRGKSPDDVAARLIPLFSRRGGRNAKEKMNDRQRNRASQERRGNENRLEGGTAFRYSHSAMSRGTVAIAALAVAVLSGQTLGYILIEKPVPTAMKWNAAIFMWALLGLAAGMAAVAYIMGKAVLIRNTAQAMADDRYTKRLEERLETSEERQKKIMEDFEQIRKERDATATENSTLKGEREVLTRQLKDSQEESAGHSKTISRMTEDIANRDARIQELESAEGTLTKTVAGRDAEIKTLQDQIAGQNREIANRDARIQELESAEGTLTKTVAGRDAEIKTLQDQIAGQNREIANRDARIQKLEKAGESLTKKSGQ